jgi:hypothetical protein
MIAMLILALCNALIRPVIAGDFVAWNDGSCSNSSARVRVMADTSTGCTEIKYGPSGGGHLATNAVSSNDPTGNHCTYSFYTDSTCSGTALAQTIDTRVATCSCLFFPKEMSWFTAQCEPPPSKRSVGNETTAVDMDDYPYPGLPATNTRFGADTALAKRSCGSDTPDVGYLRLLEGEVLMMLAVTIGGIVRGGFNIMINQVEFDEPGLFATNLFNIGFDAAVIGNGMIAAAMQAQEGADHLNYNADGARIAGNPPRTGYNIDITTANHDHDGGYTVREWGNQMVPATMVALVQEALRSMVGEGETGMREVFFVIDMQGDTLARITITRTF